MKRLWTLHAARWLAVFLLAAVSALSALLFAVPVPAAHAAGDTVALTLTNGTSFTYGGTAPNFTAVVTFGTKPTANYAWTVTVRLDTGQVLSSGFAPDRSPDGMTLTFTRIIANDPVAAGQRTAIASFYNPGTGETATSPAVSFTVNKAAMDLACAVNGTDGEVHFIGTGETLSIQMEPYSGSSQLPTEWRQGTYTVKFDGPTHVTYPNLTVDGNFAVSVTSPSQFGLYSLTCIFSGSPDYASSTFTDHIQYTDSSRHALGSAQLFTNPTTLQPGTNDFYLVLHAAAGLPTPTGEFQIWAGQYYTHSIALSAAGDCRLSVGGIQSMAGISKITIKYWGDVHYNIVSIDFPLTNPPIPAGTKSGGSGSVSGGNNGDNGKATPTTTGAATTTETPGDELTPTVVSAGAVVTSTPTDSGGNTGLIIIVAVVILLLAGAGAATGIVIYRMRRASALGDDGAQASYGSPQAGYGQPRQYRDLGWSGQSDQYRDYGGPGQSGQYQDGGRSGGYSGYGGASYDDQTSYSQDDW